MHLSPQIVIPFFSLLIKDIYFLNEGCANRLPNGHVNFEVSRPPSPPAPLYHPNTCVPWCDNFVVFSSPEICGAGAAGWGVHDMETGGVSV